MSAQPKTVPFDAASNVNDASASYVRLKRDNGSLSFDLPDFSWDAQGRMWGGGSQPTGSHNTSFRRSPRRQALLLTLGIWIGGACCFAGGSYLARELYNATVAADASAGEDR